MIYFPIHTVFPLTSPDDILSYSYYLPSHWEPWSVAVLYTVSENVLNFSVITYIGIGMCGTKINL